MLLLERKFLDQERLPLTISNKEMEEIMKIVKSLEESDLLVKSVSQTTKISKSSLAAGHT